MTAAPRPAVFLDRDGTIIEDLHYLSDPGGVRLLPGAAEAIAALNRAGVPVIIVTNQSGIGRGLYSEGDFHAVQARLLAFLEDRGATVTATYFCPHAPDHTPPCDCRKPAPGLFERAASEHAIDLTTSVYVGDRLRDLEPGIRFGGTGYLIGLGGVPERGASLMEWIGVADLQEAVAHIVAALPTSHSD